MEQIFGINKTVEHFPEDYIAPGEFRWCQNGFHLLPEPRPMPCALCHELDFDPETESGRKPTAQEIAAERSKRVERIALAQKRKDEGVPKIFWMRDLMPSQSKQSAAFSDVHELAEADYSEEEYQASILRAACFVERQQQRSWLGWILYWLGRR